jgi:AcrR family transcriptional regulator
MREPGTRHRLGSQRDPAVDQVVLQATRELLVERGYIGTTIERIAQRAGVGRPTIYRRWPSKAHVVHEAVFPPVDFDLPTEPTFADEIASLVRSAVAVFGDAAARSAVPGLMMEMRADPTLQSVLAERLERPARERFRDESLQVAIERGEARPSVDPDTVFDVLAGATVFALGIRDEPDLERFATSLTDLLLHGCLEPSS